MRRPRLLASEGFRHAIYHCVSRVVNREMVFGDREKAQFAQYLRLYAKLFGLNVLTHCLMDNHFHILVEVPRRPEVLPTDQQLVALVRATLGEARADNLADRLALWEKQEDFQSIDNERDKWFRQMWNLASFMKVLKQRFSQWFNGTRPTRRTGTLWEERYRSILVQEGRALQEIAAYIDLNPVRAGLVRDPKDYRWNGYGGALVGDAEAQAGLRWIAEHPSADGQAPAAVASTPIGDVLAWYRRRLYMRGEVERNQEGEVVRAGFSEEEIQEVIGAGGRLPMTALLRLRVRAFTDGVALGTREFVESVFQEHRSRFSAKRQSGSRRLLRLDLADPLRVARICRVGK
jgi:REP element-mobilizing transposase RayT